jgi:hypothetical protein
MATRREIKSQHENAVIDAALRAHNQRMGTSFVVESQPVRPDAILVDGKTQTWIEHTDAFYPGWAEDLTSYAASDKPHRSMRTGLHSDMDEKVADAFCKIALKKFEHKPYRSVIEQFGPGILVVGLESPWLDEETIKAINRRWAELGSPDLSSVFRWVYLGYRSDGRNQADLWAGT